MRSVLWIVVLCVILLWCVLCVDVLCVVYFVYFRQRGITGELMSVYQIIWWCMIRWLARRRIDR